MAVLPVVIHPDDVLRKKCTPVETITPEILTLLDDMLDTMYDFEGIGLAAPQVNQTCRVVVMDVEQTDEGRGNPIKMINPEIIAKSDTQSVLDEGCLSLPTMRVDVARPENVTVRYMNEKGETVELQADGLLAKCIQHELDHLNGVLIFDYLTPLKRNMVLRRYQKQMRHAAAD